MSDQPLPVWLHHETCREIYFALQESATTETLNAFRRAWDSAPADTPEALYESLVNDFPGFASAHGRFASRRGLLALGYPRTEQA